MILNMAVGLLNLPPFWVWFQHFGDPDVERLLTFNEFLFTFAFCIVTYDAWFYHSHR